MFLPMWSLILVFLAMGLTTRIVLSSLDKLASDLTWKGKTVLATVLIALSTSLPELFITIGSVLVKKPEFALGTILGSNLADLSIILGGATLLAGSLSIIGDYWRWELAATFMAGVAPILLMMDGRLSRIDGLILIVIYLIYLSELVVDSKKKHLVKMGTAGIGLLLRFRNKNESRLESVLKILVGLFLMMVCGVLTVNLGIGLASEWGMSLGLIGLLVVSIGTTIPELFVSAEAIWKKKVALVLGNILGNIISNATLIVGLLALIHPFGVEKVENYALANIGFVLIFGLFWMFTSTKKKLERWEGLILLGLFLTFVGISLMFPF